MVELDKKINQTAENIVFRLKKHKKTVAFAESCTGGMAASSLVDIDGASKVLKGGIVAYTPGAKERWLGVKKGTMKKYGLVSRQTAKEMAAGIIKKSGADYAVSFTGLAGSGDNKGEPKVPVKEKDKKKNDPDAFKPVGLVYVALAVKKTKKVYVMELNLSGARNTIRKKAVLSGLFILENEIKP